MDRYIKPVTTEDREFMQRLYRRAKKPKEQLKIICQLFPFYTKKQIKQTLGLEREITARDEKEYEMKSSYNQIKKPARKFDEAIKAAAVKAVLVDGEKNVVVAERFGITRGTLSNWCRKAKEKQLDYMKYAEKVEEDLAVEQDAAAEGYDFDWQRLGYDDPERQAMEAEIKSVEAEMKVEAETVAAETGTEKPFSVHKVDENTIKAAAYDAITIQMAMYPDSSTDTMMRFIQGVQALAQILCDEVDRNG